MNIAYLILAHKNPNQLKRLVNSLYTQNTWFFIHLDSKVTKVQDFFEAVNGPAHISFIQQRVSVNWGAYSMVQATLNGLLEIAGTGHNFDYITLLSGQDYPIKSNRHILDFYTQNCGKEFINYRLFPCDTVPQYLTERIEYYYDYDNTYSIFGSPNSNIYETEMKQTRAKRRFIAGMKPFHGSQWWSLTGNCIKYILSLIEKNKEIINFYRYTKFPDEQFFQTIVMNSSFSQSVLYDSLWYLDWPGDGPLHPKTLTAEDLSSLVNTPALFARKFDETTDPDILDTMDGLRQQ